MNIADFDYDLPPAAIAQEPLIERDAARLLVATDPTTHLAVSDLPLLLQAGDVIVVNDTRVLPARLHLQKATGGKVEVFLLNAIDDDPNGSWRALVRPSRRVQPGTDLFLAADATTPVVRVGEDHGEGRRTVTPLEASSGLAELATAHGDVPLPPYITQTLADPDRYQTVYSARSSSVAAPTAGLHFTPDLMKRCEAAGADIHRVELAVGLGTFRPITVEDVADHRMHAERYTIPASTWDACQQAARVIAIGTTSVRALETAAATGSLSGESELFISPGFDWQVVDALLTNFHMPKSSLLVMLAAFAGDRWRDLYAAALADGYRFLSFGDAMFVERGLSNGRR